MAQPARRSFGSRMIITVLASDFSGDVRIDYLPGGVVCTLVALLTSLATSQYPASPTNGPLPDQKADANGN